MKKALLAGLFLMMGITAVNAQSNKLLNAYNLINTQEWDKAAVEIEPCTTHPKTAENAKTWYRRGLIYQQIYQAQLNKEQKYMDMTKYPDPLRTAVESYLKCKTLDTRKIDEQDLTNRLNIAGNQMVDKGIREYNEKTYERAAGSFELAKEVSTKFGRTDSLAIYNAALAYEKSGNADKAIQYYQETINIQYMGSKVYYFLANIHRDKGDMDMYNKVIADGLAKYPDDQSLITAQINTYLQSDNSEAALENLNKAIANDPENKTLYFARATMKEKTEDIEGAQADYEKAIAMDGDYFDAVYNLGALFFNKGVEQNEVANAVPPSDLKKYEEEKAKATDYFKKALPHLEKAEQINGEDLATLQSLKQLYAFLKDNDNYARINEKLKN